MLILLLGGGMVWNLAVLPKGYPYTNQLLPSIPHIALLSERIQHDNEDRDSQARDLKYGNEFQKGLDTKTTD
jgi:hypothetical protein